MKYQIKPFVKEYLAPAVKLFLANYKSEQITTPLLPPGLCDDPEWIKKEIENKAANPGIAIFDQGEMVAFMITGYIFNFKGQKAAMIPEYLHASIEKDKRNLNQLAYMHLSSKWIENGIHLHLIGHFAHDHILLETLFQLGFGAILSERLRDLSLIDVNADFEILQENVPDNLVNIELEHRLYYRQAPIFLAKNVEREQIIESLEEYKSNGDTFFVCYQNKQVFGYFVVGESARDAEGFLLQNTRTAQIKGAYIRPEMRDQGIGTCILNKSINWAKVNGFERLFVEHETANYFGGRFWEKHFTPYLYFSMRYIDSGLGSE